MSDPLRGLKKRHQLLPGPLRLLDHREVPGVLDRDELRAAHPARRGLADPPRELRVLAPPEHERGARDIAHARADRRVALEAMLITAPREQALMAAPRSSPLGLSKQAEEFLRDNPAARKIARAAVEDYVRRMRALDDFAKGSALTEAQALEIGRAWRRGIGKRVSGQ